MRSSPLIATILVLTGSVARGDLLDPNAFAPITVANGDDFTVTVNNGGASLLDQITNQSYSGVVSNGIAVFDFAAGTTIQGIRVIGTLPIGLLSRGDLSVGNVNYDAAGVDAFGIASFSGNGAGGGMAGGAGGVGATNGRPVRPGLPGGAGAGGLLFQLNAGANGTRTVGIAAAPSDSQGAGAVEIVALGRLSVGSISARGNAGLAASGFGANGGGGGGGGGGIVLSGNALSIAGTLDVSGGAGGMTGFAGGGGGGGGGEIVLFSGTGGLDNRGTFNISGGPGVGNPYGDPMYGSPGQAGGNGTIVTVSVVPEPSSVLLLGLGAGMAAGLGARRALRCGRLVH